MTKGREATEGLEGQARGSAIDSWLGQVTESLLKETDPELLSRHLDVLAWILWQSGADSGARDLLAVSESLSSEDEVIRQLNRARTEGLFSAFLAELRVVEQSALDPADADSKS